MPRRRRKTTNSGSPNYKQSSNTGAANNNNGAAAGEDDDDYLDVRTKDLLVLHLPELKVRKKQISQLIETTNFYVLYSFSYSSLMGE